MRTKNAPGASGSLQDGMWCDLWICNSVRNDTKKQTAKSALFRANLREQKLSPALSTVESNMDEVAEHISRVSMGLTLNRQTAQNLTVNCQKRIILTVDHSSTGAVISSRRSVLNLRFQVIQQFLSPLKNVFKLFTSVASFNVKLKLTIVKLKLTNIAEL